jgi:hypothetical protein
MRAKVKGTSLTQNGQCNREARITSATYKGYNYRNANLKGQITDGVFEADVAMVDPI